MEKNIVQLNNISYSYENTGILVLENISFSILPKTFTILVGESGCGKSTILKIIAGIIKPKNGTIIAPKKISMVFQNGALLPWRTIYENVLLGIEDSNLSEKQKKNKSRKCT